MMKMPMRTKANLQGFARVRHQTGRGELSQVAPFRRENDEKAGPNNDLTGRQARGQHQ